MKLLNVIGSTHTSININTQSTVPAFVKPKMLDSSPEDEDFPGRLLHQAALWDNTELLEDLLAGGQQNFINSQDSWGRTPLHAAAITDNSKCLQFLLNSGADPNIQCGLRGEKKTPLHLAAEHGHVKNILSLLQHNADLSIRDSKGMTGIDLAEKCGHVKCVMVLKEASGKFFIKIFYFLYNIWCIY
ncbi:unnamed protein product [Diabrotica balteata]|uniref:Uncharacterized protein n=1 Tax=Diabrotica balteata TaxID=107213 RepID=A0A9N9TEP1_DIABA|nr:unnamed protein product [Diabrotica balteata]